MYDPFDGLGADFRGDAIALASLDGSVAAEPERDPSETLLQRLASRVVMQVVADLREKRATVAERLDAAKYIMSGDSDKYVRAASAGCRPSTIAARISSLHDEARETMSALQRESEHGTIEAPLALVA